MAREGGLVPVPGQPRNPLGQTADRFELEQPRFAVKAGETPGLMAFTTRGMVQAAGNVRHLWRQVFAYVPAGPGYSWTANRHLSTRSAARGFQLTRSLRYLTRSLYAGAGSDNTRFAGLHTAIAPRARQPRATLGAGGNRGKPVTRNRLTSFGSRVPPLQDRPNSGTMRRGVR